MKAVWAVLVSFTLLQSIALTECPCGVLCGHKNACTDNPADDCCKDNAPAGETTCFHLEPQTELDAGAIEAPDLPMIDVALVPAGADRLEPAPSRTVSSSDPSPPARDGPLHLLHSTLLL